MPFMQAMASRLNEALGPQNIDSIAVDKLGSSGSLEGFLRGAGIVATDSEMGYLDGWPEGLKEVLRAALRSALSRPGRMPVTISWSPGYDYEVQVWEAPGTAASRGGMTILMRSRYPADAHPSPPQTQS